MKEKEIEITFQDEDKVNVVTKNVKPIDMIFAVESLVRTAAKEAHVKPEEWAHAVLGTLKK